MGYRELQERGDERKRIHSRDCSHTREDHGRDRQLHSREERGGERSVHIRTGATPKREKEVVLHTRALGALICWGKPLHVRGMEGRRRVRAEEVVVRSCPGRVGQPAWWTRYGPRCRGGHLACGTCTGASGATVCRVSSAICLAEADRCVGCLQHACKPFSHVHRAGAPTKDSGTHTHPL